MATTSIHSTMLVFVLVFALVLDLTDAQTGVCYGRLGNNLPSPEAAVALCNRYNIRRMRIYDPDQRVLQALRGSNIEVTVGVPNDRLADIANNPNSANAWVQNNIRNYGNVRFRYIAVGNEVSPIRDTARYVNFVLPAMRNINNAINAAGLGNQIKVSTAVETGLITNSYPPNNGVFRGDVAGYINPIVRFLADTRGPLLVNVYPYFSYISNKAQIQLSYALFTGEGVVVPGGIRYQNLLYALVDATYAALEKAGGGSVPIVVSESGWPSAGGDTTTIENARLYNTNLISRVRSGTPKRPGRAIETYIFGLFDENLKNPEYEKHFGIFYATGQQKYGISF